MSGKALMTEKQLQVAVLSFILLSFLADCAFIWLLLKAYGLA